MKKIALSLALGLTLLSNSLLVNAATTDITNTSGSSHAEVQVTSSKNSTFTVGLPVSAELGPTTGTGYYQIQVKGDIDSQHKLVVKPVDKYTAEDGDLTSNYNFILKNETNTDAHKDDIIVTITPTKTEFVFSEINPTTPVNVNTTLQANSLGAGSWKGIIEYNISLEDI